MALALDSLNEALALVTDASERATLRARFALVIIEHADHEDGLRKNVLKLAQDALMLSHRGTAGPHPPIVLFFSRPDATGTLLLDRGRWKRGGHGRHGALQRDPGQRDRP